MFVAFNRSIERRVLTFAGIKVSEKSFKFSVISYDSGCTSKIAAGNAVRLMVEEKVDAFIGPPCSTCKHIKIVIIIQK